MFNKFKTDLENAKEAEKIVKKVLELLAENYDFTDVSDEKEYWHLGDIKFRYTYNAYLDRYDRTHYYFDENYVEPLKQEEFDFCNYDYFIDVKDDSRIGDTGNILCEEKVYFKTSGKYAKGNMYSGYDYLAIVSKNENKIYMLDFHLLQKHYKEGRKIRINHKEQWNDVYLYSLDKAKEDGILMATIEYERENNIFYPINVIDKKNYLELSLITF